MGRPRKDTEAGKKATAKWRETMLKRYGAEKLHEMMVTNGRTGGQRSSNGGFASNKVGKDGLTGRQRSIVAGARGGLVSRRNGTVANPIQKMSDAEYKKRIAQVKEDGLEFDVDAIKNLGD